MLFYFIAMLFIIGTYVAAITAAVIACDWLYKKISRAKRRTAQKKDVKKDAVYSITQNRKLVK